MKTLLHNLFKQSLYLLIVATLILFSVAYVVVAQEDESTETPEPVATVVVSPVETGDDAIEMVDFLPEDTPEGTLLNTILEGIAAVVYLPAAAGIVTVLTSAIKRFSNFKSKFVALTIMIVLWGIYSLAGNLGYETQLTSILDSLTQIGYILLGATGTHIVATKVYEQSVKTNMPVVGYSRHVAEYQRTANEANG